MNRFGVPSRIFLELVVSFVFLVFVVRVRRQSDVLPSDLFVLFFLLVLLLLSVVVVVFIDEYCWILSRSSTLLLPAPVVVHVVVVVVVVVVIRRRATVSSVILFRGLGERFYPATVLIKLDAIDVPDFLIFGVGIVQRSAVSGGHQLIQRVSSFGADFVELFRRSQFEHPECFRRASGRFSWPHFVSGLPLRGFDGR